jgi:hypothetical protein
MFTLVFRLYNFLHSMKSQHDHISSQLITVLASIRAKTENLPLLVREDGSDGSNSGSYEVGTPESRDSLTARITL